MKKVIENFEQCRKKSKAETGEALAEWDREMLPHMGSWERLLGCHATWMRREFCFPCSTFACHICLPHPLPFPLPCNAFLQSCCCCCYYLLLLLLLLHCSRARHLALWMCHTTTYSCPTPAPHSWQIRNANAESQLVPLAACLSCLFIGLFSPATEGGHWPPYKDICTPYCSISPCLHRDPTRRVASTPWSLEKLVAQTK